MVCKQVINVLWYYLLLYFRTLFKCYNVIDIIEGGYQVFIYSGILKIMTTFIIVLPGMYNYNYFLFVG